VATRAKSKAPLSDFHQVKQAIKALQREVGSQFALEHETQATLEYLNNQIQALRSAFNTLSEVIMEEVDTIRLEAKKRCESVEALVNRQAKIFQDTQSEIGLLRRTLDMWSMKERDWAKDTEILKVSHTHNVEWMQQLQRDNMEVREQLSSVKQDHMTKLSKISEEGGSLRLQWEQQMELVNAKLREFQVLGEQQNTEIKAQSQQRADDLELLEKAITTTQKQQARLRQSVEESNQATVIDAQNLQHKIDAIDESFMAFKLENSDLQRSFQTLSHDNKMRFENISRVFKVFADSMHIPAPSLYEPASIPTSRKANFAS